MATRPSTGEEVHEPDPEFAASTDVATFIEADDIADYEAVDCCGSHWCETGRFIKHRKPVDTGDDGTVRTVK